MPAHKIIKNLTKKGTSVLGVGCYSAVLASGSEKVIKVGADMGDPWLDYYHMIVKPMQANTHVPKIHSFYAEDSYYIASMERLEEVKPCTDAANLVDFIKDYIDTRSTEEEFRQTITEFPKLVPNIEEFMQAVNKLKEYTVFNSTKRDAEGNDMNDLWEQGFEDRCLDLHTGNVMLRGNVLVITDPWCNIDMQDIPDLSCWAEENIQWQN